MVLCVPGMSFLHSHQPTYLLNTLNKCFCSLICESSLKQSGFSVCLNDFPLDFMGCGRSKLAYTCQCGMTFCRALSSASGSLDLVS